MKKTCYLSFFAGVLWFISGCAVNPENKTSREIFEDYEGSEGFYSLSLPPSWFNIAVPDNEEDLKELIYSMKKMKVLIFEGTDIISIDSMYAEMDGKFQKARFEDLFAVNSGPHRFTIKVKEKEEVVHDLVIMGNDQKGFLGLSLEGEVELQTIIKLARNIDFSEFSGLRNISE